MSNHKLAPQFRRAIDDAWTSDCSDDDPELAALTIPHTAIANRGKMTTPVGETAAMFQCKFKHYFCASINKHGVEDIAFFRPEFSDYRPPRGYWGKRDPTLYKRGHQLKNPDSPRWFQRLRGIRVSDESQIMSILSDGICFSIILEQHMALTSATPATAPPSSLRQG